MPLIMSTLAKGSAKMVTSGIMKKTLFITFFILCLPVSLFPQDTVPKDKGFTDLMVAVADKNFDAVKDMLAKGADVNARNNDGVTSLMFAALNNEPKIAQALIDKGAKVDLQDYISGATALIWASTSNSVDSAKVLLLNKADKTIKNKYGKTALDYARSDEMTALLK